MELTNSEDRMMFIRGLEWTGLERKGAERRGMEWNGMAYIKNLE